MNRNELILFLNKVVFLELEEKLYYTCKILHVGEDSFTFIDKFEITASREIKLIKEITEIKDQKILDLFKSFEVDMR